MAAEKLAATRKQDRRKHQQSQQECQQPTCTSVAWIFLLWFLSYCYRNNPSWEGNSQAGLGLLLLLQDVPEQPGCGHGTAPVDGDPKATVAVVVYDLLGTEGVRLQQLTTLLLRACRVCSWQGKWLCSGWSLTCCWDRWLHCSCAKAAQIWHTDKGTEWSKQQFKHSLTLNHVCLNTLSFFQSFPAKNWIYFHYT